MGEPKETESQADNNKNEQPGATDKLENENSIESLVAKTPEQKDIEEISSEPARDDDPKGEKASDANLDSKKVLDGATEANESKEKDSKPEQKEASIVKPDETQT